jgi:hypothetical protein
MCNAFGRNKTPHRFDQRIGRYFVGDDGSNVKGHGSCTEINKFRVARHELTVRSLLSVIDAGCQVEEMKVETTAVTKIVSSEGLASVIGN